MGPFLLQIWALLFLSSSANAAFTINDLEQLLSGHRAPRTMEQLLPILPKEFRENFLLVYESRSPFHASITPNYPRVILFSHDTRLVLTFTGHPKKPGFNFLEAMFFDEEQAAFRLKTFVLPAAAKSGLTTETQSCVRCHGEDTRPINDSYPLWPGFYGSIQDTFPLSLKIGLAEKTKYEKFLHSNAKRGVYRHLIFPKGSSVSPFLDPKGFSVDKTEADVKAFRFLPNTRFGMALTELNRRRLLRKLIASPTYEQREREYLYELLDCGPTRVTAEEKTKIYFELTKENHERLLRLGANPDDPSQRMNDMQELKFSEALAQVEWVARSAGVSREDWSMALEANSFSFFDGILGGEFEGKSYYVKQDLIHGMLERLSKKDNRLQRYFQASVNYKGYPFGSRVDIPLARKSCDFLLKK